MGDDKEEIKLPKDSGMMKNSYIPPMPEKGEIPPVPPPKEEGQEE